MAGVQRGLLVACMCLALSAGLPHVAQGAGGRHLSQAGSVAGCSLATAAKTLPIPLPRIHSHNDYEHEMPLFEALAEGFCSIEADPYLVNGTQYVAHDATDIKMNRTLQSLYLEPLARIVAKNGGYVYPASRYSGTCQSIILLVDFKGGASLNATGGGVASTDNVTIAQYDNLEALLARYQRNVSGLFTTYYANGTVAPGAINILVSGSRPPPAYVAAKPVRLSALDGRLIDLAGPFGTSIYPLVSQGWCCGNGTVLTAFPAANSNSPDLIPSSAANLTNAQLDYVMGLVETAHAQGRIIRFWNTPDNPSTWDLMLDLDTDLVNTDKLRDLHDWVLTQIAGLPATTGKPALVKADAASA